MKCVKKLKALVLLFIGLVSMVANGQQDPNFNLYRYHMNVINPAYAGAQGETFLASSIRRQWTNIQDAPETQIVSFGTPVAHRLGLGVSMINESSFVEKQTFATVDASYELPFSAGSTLYLGLKAGGNFYSVNASGLETYNINSDPSLQDISNFSPNIGVGAYWTAEGYYLSLSVPRLLSSEKVKAEDGMASTVTDRPHLYLSGGYDIDLSGEWTLEPSTLLRYVSGAPASLELTAMTDYKQILKFGLSYRTDKAMAGLVKLNLWNQFDLGYAYETQFGKQVIANAGNTHELFLRYRFNTAVVRTIADASED